MSSYGYNSGTVTTYEDFDAESDAETLRAAMKGLGTDEESIIEILANRTNAQRLEIIGVYKSSFGRDLIDDLKGELSGDFEDAILAIMTPTIDFLAQELNRAISGAGTDEAAIVEIMTTCNNSELDDIKSSYENQFEKPLEDDLIGDTSGDFRRLVVSLCCALRDESGEFGYDETVADAQALFDAGEEQWGTEEAVFNKILVTRGLWHLLYIFDQYEKIAGRTIEEAIDSETSGDLQMGLLAIVKCARSRPAYFAERLYNSMQGGGTDDKTLIRVVASRSERDMIQIKEEFEKNYGQTLEEYISGDTGGDYRRLLLALVKG